MAMSPTLIFSCMSVGVVLGIGILILILWICVRNTEDSEGPGSCMQQSSLDSSKYSNCLIRCSNYLIKCSNFLIKCSNYLIKCLNCLIKCSNSLVKQSMLTWKNVLWNFYSLFHFFLKFYSFYLLFTFIIIASLSSLFNFMITLLIIFGNFGLNLFTFNFQNCYLITNLKGLAKIVVIFIKNLDFCKRCNVKISSMNEIWRRDNGLL